MNVVVALLNILLIGWIAFYFRKSTGALQKFFWPALVVKLLAGIGVGVIYIYYYKVGDTLLYFSEGTSLSAFAKNDFFGYIKFVFGNNAPFPNFLHITSQEPRALFFVKVVSLFSLVSFDNYWIIGLYFSLFSFLGAWYFVVIVNRHFADASLAAIIAFLFFPTAVFWGAGVIKESLAMASIFFLSGIFIRLWFLEKLRFTQWLLAIVCGWLTWQLKYYFAAIFFSMAITTLLHKIIVSRWISMKSFVLQIFTWLLLFIVPLAIVMVTLPNFHPQRLLQVIVENYDAFYALSAPEDLIHFKNLEPNIRSIASNAPWALLSGLFRPFVWESHNVWQLIVALENALLTVLFTLSLFGLRSIPNASHRMLIFCSMIYIALLCIFLTLSTPNFGTLSRYRVSFLPYFVFLILCSSYNIKILRSSFNRLVQ